MSKSWPKIIRDPVHNIIPFEDTDCDRLLLSLINTKEFQRLRRIKQLGLSQLTFPGADHSRFAHSIGVMHVARRLLDRIAGICPNCLDDESRTVVLAAALLHDVGHGPFSHAFEKITGDNHERRTIEIIESEETDVNRELQQISSTLPTQVKSFFDEDVEDSSSAGSLSLPCLTQIVTSQLDADRFDYLLRDSYSTGTESGRFDLDWLIQHLELDDSRGRFFLNSKALFAAEAYVFARYHMYRTVYYHKTTRAGEVMLRLLFKRYKELLDKATNSTEQDAIVPNSPPAVRDAFSGSIDLQSYLLLDDHSLTEFAKACMKCSDGVLSSLSDGLLNRRLFKAVDVTEAGSPSVAEFVEKAKEIVEEAGLPVSYNFAYDTPSDTAYKSYNPDSENPATQIYVADGSGNQKELSRLSANVGNLTKPYTLFRYYFPEKVRGRIKSEAVPLLVGTER